MWVWLRTQWLLSVFDHVSSIFVGIYIYNHTDNHFLYNLVVVTFKQNLTNERMESEEGERSSLQRHLCNERQWVTTLPKRRWVTSGCEGCCWLHRSSMSRGDRDTWWPLAVTELVIATSSKQTWMITSRRALMPKSHWTAMVTIIKALCAEFWELHRQTTTIVGLPPYTHTSQHLHITVTFTLCAHKATPHLICCV